MSNNDNVVIVSSVAAYLLRKNNYCASFSNHKIPIRIFGAYLMSDMSRNITARPINPYIFEIREKRSKRICKNIHCFSLFYNISKLL